MNLAELDPHAREIIHRYDEPRAAMLPLLWLVQEKLGHIPSDAEFWVGRHLGVAVSHVREVVSFYSMFRTKPVGRRELRVCTSLPCMLRGAEDVLAHIKQQLKVGPGETTAGGELTVTEVECLCACEIAPMAQLDEQFVGPLNETGALDRILSDALRAPGNASREPQPFISTEGPVVSTRLKNTDGTWWDAYVASGGYLAAKKALSLKPEQIIDEVSRSNLRGLGGAGFPTARKWSFIPKNSPKPKYLVVNGDEGEPGTFKDRYILERDPHALLEGMIIAAYTIGSHKAYVYIRGEYFRSAERFGRAVREAYDHGWLGANIQGSGFDLDLVIHRGAGAYICGEETALLTSLEGGKGFPRLKPPFPAISGLFQCPTIINNVETLACVPFILREGADRFAEIGTAKQGGTRLFCVCGHVNRPGVYEAPVSVTLRELIENHAQGVRGGRKLKAVIPGGISAKVLTAAEIDVGMDFDSLAAAGSMAGSGGVIVMDETTCMLDALQSASKFFAHESCGQCSPCREGTGWVYRILRRISEGKGRLQDLDDLLAIARDMEGKTICVFADAAAWPVQSYITKFREEFEEHIRTGRCPTDRGKGQGCNVPTLTIDGRQISSPDGSTVIQAAEKLGIFVPRYCYHPGLSIAGNCRICLVDVEKNPKLQIACNTPVTEGMVVHTKSEKAEDGRRAVLEFLLANHPLDCPVCDQSGECELQNFYMNFGVYDPRFREQKVKKKKAVAVGPHVMLDQERCILCSRCVRFADEITKTGEFGIFNRGDRAELGLYPGQELNNPYSGNVIDVCPVGALTERDFRFKARVWYLSSAPSVCSGCAQGCNIDVHYVLDRPHLNNGARVLRLKPRYNGDVNQWWMCDEGRFGFHWIDHGRLTKVRHRGAESTWETAIAAITESLTALHTSGAGSRIGVIASSKLTNEDLFVIKEIFQTTLRARVTASVATPSGYRDDFLIKADKNPNTLGATLLGLAGPGAPSAASVIADALQGRVAVLWVFGHDLAELIGEAQLEELSRKVELLIFSGTNENRTTARAHWSLPTAAYLEKDGTFVNCHGRIQRIGRAFPPLADSREDWKLLLDIARRLDHPLAWRNPQQIFLAMAKAATPFEGLTYKAIGSQGAQVRQ